MYLENVVDEADEGSVVVVVAAAVVDDERTVVETE